MSIFSVFGYINEVISSIFGGKESVMRKLVKSSPDFDYGAETSIREAVSQLLYSQHFQKLDKERYFKIIEKRIFNMFIQGPGLSAFRKLDARFPYPIPFHHSIHQA